MIHRSIALPVALIALGAAVPPLDPLQTQLVADARAARPTAFERTTTIVQSDGATRETEVRIDRWDGKAWTLVSIDGKPPAAEVAAKAANDAVAKPTPGYHRLADFLASPATRTTGADGAVVLHIASLPRGTVSIAGDRSDQFTADATVEDAGSRPWVRRLAFHARAPFRVLLVARIDRFEVVNDYALGAAGRPWLVRQVQDYSGSLPGQRGTVHTAIAFRSLN
jgi:hypothetical protein